ncbi:MAG: right-handed parallel beta-helix repeat-containing protein [Verrucomicrobia bacterium]|nr:right-handed parallel beta-helix repeat-containing protein [Verrucomicrobiota bacterium]
MNFRLIFLVAILLAKPAFARAGFFVAPNGSDANAGTKSKPFATLDGARDAIRHGIGRGDGKRKPITIWIRGGDYLRTRTLEFTAADSGTAAAPITWRAYKNEPVRLLGGRTLTGFKAVSDSGVLARLDEKARGKVVELNLRALGMSDFGELKSRGFSRSAVAHSELFFDHRPMTLARWPNAGEFAKITGYPAGQKDEHGGTLGGLPDGFNCAGDRPSHWQDISDLWVHGYWAYDWANSYEKVAALDVAQHLVKTVAPHGLYGFRKDQRFYFLNVFEELDQPGEWFLDRKTGMLYFWPPEQGGGNATKETIISLLDQPLLKLTDVSHVTFRGITFEATRGNAIEIQGGSSNRIAGCLIRNIGNSGVVINGGSGHGVVSCDISDTGDGGVSLTGGDRQTLTPGGHFVENCHFQRLGHWSKCYVPAIALNGVGQRASHNLIHDHPHCAILYWGNDHVMEFNEIHHIALETGDVGAIYTGRDYTFRGNKIRHNFIHHTGGVGMGSMGVYMDDCVSGTEVFGNVFYKVHWAMFIGGGRDHRVENNLFVDCDPAVRADGRGLDKSPVWRGMVDDTMRKRLAEVPLALYRQRYPEMKSLDRYYGPPEGPAITGDAFKGVPPDDNLIIRNVCVGKWADAGWHASLQTLRLENNLTNATTSLVTAPNDQSGPRDFALKKDSPAWALGFHKIPVEQIGLREDELRRELKRFMSTTTR